MQYVQDVEDQFSDAATGGAFRAVIVNEDSSTGLYCGEATKKNSAIVATDPLTLMATS